eukprot:TRINITY_DN3314_c4_g8_i1.p1 TRINITY_DN3314_c4_g8~~TRINITY_DN3314_c4_g8_i1.p1  ORF type:complete len:1232 (-),score=249.61 TRINITY_DN3314_c4_g8_i1:628-4323(-)
MVEGGHFKIRNFRETRSKYIWWCILGICVISNLGALYLKTNFVLNGKNIDILNDYDVYDNIKEIDLLNIDIFSFIISNAQTNTNSKDINGYLTLILKIKNTYTNLIEDVEDAMTVIPFFIKANQKNLVLSEIDTFLDKYSKEAFVGRDYYLETFMKPCKYNTQYEGRECLWSDKIESVQLVSQLPNAWFVLGTFFSTIAVCVLCVSNVLVGLVCVLDTFLPIFKPTQKMSVEYFYIYVTNCIKMFIQVLVALSAIVSFINIGFTEIFVISNVVYGLLFYLIMYHIVLQTIMTLLLQFVKNIFSLYVITISLFFVFVLHFFSYIYGIRLYNFERDIADLLYVPIPPQLITIITYCCVLAWVYVLVVYFLKSMIFGTILPNSYKAFNSSGGFIFELSATLPWLSCLSLLIVFLNREDSSFAINLWWLCFLVGLTTYAKVSLIINEKNEIPGTLDSEKHLFISLIASFSILCGTFLQLSFDTKISHAILNGFFRVALLNGLFFIFLFIQVLMQVIPFIFSIDDKISQARPYFWLDNSPNMVVNITLYNEELKGLMNTLFAIGNSVISGGRYRKKYVTKNLRPFMLVDGLECGVGQELLKKICNPKLLGYEPGTWEHKFGYFKRGSSNIVSPKNITLSDIYSDDFCSIDGFWRLPCRYFRKKFIFDKESKLWDKLTSSDEKIPVINIHRICMLNAVETAKILTPDFSLRRNFVSCFDKDTKFVFIIKEHNMKKLDSLLYTQKSIMTREGLISAIESSEKLMSHFPEALDEKSLEENLEMLKTYPSHLNEEAAIKNYQKYVSYFGMEHKKLFEMKLLQTAVNNKSPDIDKIEYLNGKAFALFPQGNDLQSTNFEVAEFMMQLDGDTEPDSELLGRLVNEIYSCKNNVAAAGRPVPTQGFRQPLIALEYHLSAVWGNAYKSKMGKVSCLPGCAALTRINSKEVDHAHMTQRDFDAFSRVVDFNTNGNDDVTLKMFEHEEYIAHNLGEDRALTAQFLSAGYRITTVPSAIVLTETPPTMLDYFIQRRRWNNSTLFVNYYLKNKASDDQVDNLFEAKYSDLNKTSTFHSLILKASIYIDIGLYYCQPASFVTFLFSMAFGVVNYSKGNLISFHSNGSSFITTTQTAHESATIHLNGGMSIIFILQAFFTFVQLLFVLFATFRNNIQYYLRVSSNDQRERATAPGVLHTLWLFMVEFPYFSGLSVIKSILFIGDVSWGTRERKGGLASSFDYEPIRNNPQ